ncbi:hypothetical protein [Dickeya sp. NCPPB 3274]|uniref:hypothetical protein n=1 Tax=Dickeya sp. NCPPB 3274 TaxID=568766 RepID=UPI00210FB0A8|nr:hypothetical protein [Dickeya sp. NCPPB 3274]
MRNVPGNIPNGYKPAILLFLIINHLLFFLVNAFAAGWSSGLFSFRACPEMRPVEPGESAGAEAIFTGMTSPDQVWHDVTNNIKVLSLPVSNDNGNRAYQTAIAACDYRGRLEISPPRAGADFWAARGVIFIFSDAPPPRRSFLRTLFSFSTIYHRVELSEDDADTSLINTVMRQHKSCIVRGGFCHETGDPS